MAIARDCTDSAALPFSEFHCDYHIHTQSLSSAVPNKLYLHHLTSHSSSNGSSYVASASAESSLYLVRIVVPNRPGQRRPPSDVLMHILSSPHEGVASVLYHYFGEVYRDSSCSCCRSGRESQRPQFAFVITPFYSYPNLSELVDTRSFTINPVLAVSAFSHLVDLFLFLNAQRVSLGGTFASYVFVNPADGSMKVQNFSIAVQEQDTHDLRTLGNMFATILYPNTAAGGIFMQALRLARMLQFFEQSYSSNAWSSLRALQGSMNAANAANEQLSSNGNTATIEDVSDVWSTD
ncbi:hypothetical protein BDQ17DRAFT_1547917 [Cyathus striatus]|nr:hypothetical protein BDQ17DRAFT_1547917 [Cyathus striatus]